jgi:proline iminopeptidase
MKHVLLAILVLLLAGCQHQKYDGANKALNERGVPQYNELQAGGVKMITVDGKYQVWTKKIGDGNIKVLLLHGGPAFTHDYFECFENFFPQAGIEFYYYDQLGCGNSDIPSDTSLWTMPRYVEEVEQVRKGLGLDNFYLLGHSWGSMLAMSYLDKYQGHVKGAVLSNMTAGIKKYVAYTAKLKQDFFSPSEIKTFDSLDRLQQYTSPRYQDLLMNKLYNKVICRLDPWPEPLMRAFKKANMNIYIQMQGIDEFHVTGNFKNWEMWDKLPDIKVATLVIGGMNDEMAPEDMKEEGRLLPNSRTYLCPEGSHLSMYDDQQNYFNNLIAFLKDVDENKFKPDAK